MKNIYFFKSKIKELEKSRANDLAKNFDYKLIK